ncbi:glycosyltransferase family 4 protein [Noviherbaspirillum agri]
MNIILLTSSMGGGGAERVATTLCNAWAARGDRVSLIATFSGGGSGAFYPISESVEFFYLADKAGTTQKGVTGYVRRIVTLRRLIRETAPDVIVSFLPNVNVAALLSSAFLGIPIIICERSDPSGRSYPWALKMLCRLSYRFADMLTVQTQAVATKVGRIFPGVEKVRTIPNPLPEGVLAATAKHVDRKSPRRVLLSLGRLSPEKQIGRLLDAFAVVAPSFPDWDLHIYGDGRSQTELQQQILALGLAGRTMLMGATDQPWEVMAHADAFVMVSAYEGFPNALLEAMGIGLPCVVFDCPSGPREITSNGRDALLVPLNDQDGLAAALASMMGDIGLRRALGSRARESVRRRFSLGSVLREWDGFFMEVGAMRSQITERVLD